MPKMPRQFYLNTFSTTIGALTSDRVSRVMNGQKQESEVDEDIFDEMLQELHQSNPVIPQHSNTKASNGTLGLMSCSLQGSLNGLFSPLHFGKVG